MLNRRSLLRALFSLGGLAMLLSACKHRAPRFDKENSDGANGGGEGDGGGGGGGGGY